MKVIKLTQQELELITKFCNYWNKHYCYISYDFNMTEILDFLNSNSGNISRACDQVSDYILANGLGEVQE